MIQEKVFRENFEKTALKKLNDFLMQNPERKVITLQKEIEVISHRSDKYVYTLFYEDVLD